MTSTPHRWTAARIMARWPGKYTAAQAQRAVDVLALLDQVRRDAASQPAQPGSPTRCPRCGCLHDFGCFSCSCTCSAVFSGCACCGATDPA